jgi:hypothetical protein
MTDNQTIQQTIATLLNFKPGAPLKNYIGFARFPNFKNIERDASIEFDFPLTVLVGASGIGKSSVLHALFGMPEGHSTARFWFSTDLDPIKAAPNSADLAAVRATLSRGGSKPAICGAGRLGSPHPRAGGPRPATALSLGVVSRSSGRVWHRPWSSSS